MELTVLLSKTALIQNESNLRNTRLQIVGDFYLIVMRNYKDNFDIMIAQRYLCVNFCCCISDFGNIPCPTVGNKNDVYSIRLLFIAKEKYTFIN